MRILLLALPAAAAAAAAQSQRLPSLPLGAGEGAELRKEGSWWARVGNRVYYAPPASSGLSSRIEDYYLALGSESALTPDLRERRVGGEGRLHIFHLPHGTSMLQLGQQAGDRRSSISALSRLTQGMAVPHTFPAYPKSKGYVNPLSQRGKDLEDEVVGLVTGKAVKETLEEIVQFPTRSFSNRKSSADVQSFLQKKFEKMEFPTCLHTFRGGGPGTNVVAYIPGQTADTITLGAHYDSIPSSGPAPGAEDNGSGLAGLLVIADALHQAGVKPLRSIYLVAFAGEEPGLLGSAAFAASLGKPSTLPERCGAAKLMAATGAPSSFLQPHRSKARRGGPAAPQHEAIIMDEIGWRSAKLPKATVNLESYDTSKELMDHLVESSSDHNGDSLDVVHSSHPFGSDHMSFLRHDYPAVLTINGDDEAYPYYHTSDDKIESVTFDYVAAIAKMNAGALLRAAGLA